MEVVVEALLSASVESLFTMLGSSELLKYARKKKIHAELKKWETILRRINGLLHDAEEKQVTNEGVKIWLGELQHLAYDIEDVLDEFATETLKRKVMKDSHTSTDKLHNLIHSCTVKLQKLVSSCSFAFRRKMASEIEDISARLEDIAQQEQSLNLLTNATGTRSKQPKERPPTTSLVDDLHIYGRKDEKEAIVQKLLRDEGSDKPISVIPIVGMGGIGKTTLAQQVYNDSAIKDYFDIKVWVCVSENFDVVGLTRTILRKVDLETRDLNNLDLDSLQETLKGKLSQKKFLLILDDVWEEDYSLWDQLRRPFFSAASRSKIVVTTRKNNAAPIMGDVSTLHFVKELSDDECLLLLAWHALGANNFDAHPNLKDIGQKLVKKCNGLPLAAKVLGGLLRNKRTDGEWDCVLRNNLWNSPKTSNSVHPTLKLSYNDLPSHLKQCFVYCAIFPKDYGFRRDELVRLWMAEGFLQHPQERKTMEDLGIEYFEDLVTRSFFGPSNKWLSTFVMHDLISDLAQTIAGDICYNYENKTEVDLSSSKYEKVRHASFSFGQDSQEYEVYSRMKRLRTIWQGGYSYPDMEVYGNKMMEELSTHSKCMRVLSLSNCSITKLSNSIGDLIHLRHINLSGTNIQQLPESLSTLFNLQTLLLCNCRMLEKLPDKIGNLTNLLHLDISETYELQKLPSSIGMLTNLQTLSKFIVKKGHGATIAELKNLNDLRGSLSIQGLENVQDAKLANLNGKQGLQGLVLRWKNWYGRNDQGKNDVSVLESLEPPHQNLKWLSISCYGGAEFSSWMINNHLFSKLVSLDIEDCVATKLLPPLGQLSSLKWLWITGLKAVKTIGVEFYGNVDAPFPSLERLEISYMSQWIEWSHGNMGGEGFPNLQELKISICPKLIGSLPSALQRLQHLSQLEIEECGSLVSFAPMGLPRCLKRIDVRRCDAFECFPIIDTRDGRESLLEELEISDCSSLKYFQRNFKLPTSLKKLKILNCGNLLSLPDGLMVQDDNTRQSESESHLEKLEIVGCERLTSLPAGKFPAALKTLRICSAFECFPIIDTRDGRESLLEELEISYCPSLKYFQRNFRLPTSLRKLKILNCGNLLSLPDGLMVQDDNTRQSESESHLQELEIVGCERLTSLPAGKFPAALKTLRICSAFECFPIIDTRDGRESLLEELVISDCPSLKYFQRNFKLPTSLRKLKILNCGNLLSLPDGLMVQDDKTRQSESESESESDLEELQIAGCQGLTSFPAGKFPAALKFLKIRDSSAMQLESVISEKNTALETIEIEKCDNIKAFPSIEGLPSLRRLSISGCPALESFPKMGFLSTSLQSLQIEECQNLSLVPIRMQSHFPSLQYLTIRRCPNVGSLIEDGGLPRNLAYLYIDLCENMRPPIPIAEWGLCMLSSLHVLIVYGRCPATADVVSFPDDNCCWLPTSLKFLRISDFVSLESVSMGLQMLTSLYNLNISRCPKLRFLPKDALPSSLKGVSIRGCPLLRAHYVENRGEYSSIVHVRD